MYKSPIDIVIDNAISNIGEKIDDGITYEITTKYGVVADKNELVKALNYDRDQYKKGYSDAIAKFKEIMNSDAVNNFEFSDRYSFYLGRLEEILHEVEEMENEC